jgi:Histidine kinase-, DNA gyrase B-, and HSP90-like ATPase
MVKHSPNFALTLAGEGLAVPTVFRDPHAAPEDLALSGCRAWPVCLPATTGDCSSRASMARCRPYRLVSPVTAIAGAGVPMTSGWLRAPGAEVDQLFEPFRRGRGRITSGGVGLGLSIVRSVAHAHGGRVAAHSRTGGGLVVEVTLPTGEPSPADRPAREHGATAATAGVRPPGGTRRGSSRDR